MSSYPVTAPKGAAAEVLRAAVRWARETGAPLGRRRAVQSLYGLTADCACSRCTNVNASYTYQGSHSRVERAR